MNTSEIQQVAAGFGAHFPELFEKLGPANLEALLKAASLVDVPAERTLFRDRMPVDFLYFVVEGSLSAHVESEGVSRQIGIIHPGEWMGEVSVLSGEPQATATVIADTPCRLIKMHRIVFEKLIDENETIATVLLAQFIELMAARLRRPILSVTV